MLKQIITRARTETGLWTEENASPFLFVSAVSVVLTAPLVLLRGHSHTADVGSSAATTPWFARLLHFCKNADKMASVPSVHLHTLLVLFDFELSPFYMLQNGHHELR